MLNRQHAPSTYVRTLVCVACEKVSFFFFRSFFFLLAFVSCRLSLFSWLVRVRLCWLVDVKKMRVLLNTLSLSGFAAAHQHLYVTNERRPTAGHNPVLHVGTIDDPFSSIFDARDALRRQQRSNDKQIASTRYVHLRGGTHFLREPFVLDAVLDSGTAESPIVYTSYPGERATLSGGTALPASAFVNTTINHGLQVRSINLFEHGVNASVIGKGFSNPYPAPSLELFVGGRAMTPARHPNIGSATDPLLWNWIGYENLTGPADAAGTRSFSFTDSANAEWFAQSLDEGPLWLHGYWKYDWRDTFVDVESIESAGPGLPYVVEVSNSTPPQYVEFLVLARAA